MTLCRDVHAELVRLRAYRTSWVTWPVMAAVSVASVAFGILAVHDALAAGVPPASQILTVAFLPGMPTGITGLLVAILTTTLVTADEGSGTARTLRMTMSDGRLLRARGAMVAMTAVAATVLTTVIAVVGAATLPAGMMTRTVTSPAFWTNVAGTLLVHLTWGLLAFAFASWWPRAALSMGGVLAVMIGVPSLEMALRAAQWDTSVFGWLPEALVRAATVTGENAVTTVAPTVAITCLAAWCAGLIAIAHAGAHRLRRI